MKAYPIIHSRNYYSDFNINFYVRPKMLNIDAVREKIISGTAKIDNLKGIRYICFSSGDNLIVGVISRIKDLIKESEFSEEERLFFNEYTCDEKKRLMYCFLGYCIKKSEFNGNIPNIEIKDYLNLYKKFVIESWNEKNIPTIYSNEEFIKEQSCEGIKLKEAKLTIGDYRYFDIEDCGKEILDGVMLEILKNKDNNLSCCTNMAEYLVVAKKDFYVYSTKKNTLENLEQFKEIKSLEVIDEVSIKNNNNEVSIKKKDSIKKSFYVLVVTGSILSVIQILKKISLVLKK